MKKDLREFFYLNYNSSGSSAVLRGNVLPDIQEFLPSGLKLVHRRKEKTQDEELAILTAEERAFFSKHIELTNARTNILKVSHPLAIESLSGNVDAIINLKRINDLQSVNNFIRQVNNKLPFYGKFGCYLDPKCVQKKMIFKTLPPVISHIFYIFFFICNRMFPKMPLTASLYLKLTGGCNRVMSKTEAMGRMYAHGFEIVDEQWIGEKVYFVFRKIRKPLIDHVPTYGIIFKMMRRGKNGKLIYVYKMRTMDAYSEYLQQYVYQQNNLDKGGKFKDDFRVTTLGRFLRKYWIDELPMLINLLKGDLKLIGVRPLSAHYLSLYSRALREKRSRQKPGLLPPFYADLPKGIEQIMVSEMRYLSSYERHPFLTDVKYFFRITHNILVKMARSK